MAKKKDTTNNNDNSGTPAEAGSKTTTTASRIHAEKVQDQKDADFDPLAMDSPAPAQRKKKTTATAKDQAQQQRGKKKKTKKAVPQSTHTDDDDLLITDGNTTDTTRGRKKQTKAKAPTKPKGSATANNTAVIGTVATAGKKKRGRPRKADAAPASSTTAVVLSASAANANASITDTKGKGKGSSGRGRGKKKGATAASQLQDKKASKPKNRGENAATPAVPAVAQPTEAEIEAEKKRLAEAKVFLTSMFESTETCLAAYERHASKGDLFSFGDTVVALTTSQQTELFSSLKRFVAPLYERYLGPDLVGGRDPATFQEETHLALRAFTAVAVLLRSCARKERVAITQDALSAAVLMHDAMEHIPDVHDTHDAITSMCEAWWFAELQHRDALAPISSAKLLIKALQEGAYLQAVKRVYAYKEAYSVIDFDDSASATMRMLLKQAMINPLFLSHAEGQRFLSYILTLSPKFCLELYALMKATLPYCTSVMVGGYGNVLFRAWRMAEGTQRALIETDLVQDMMMSACHASRKKALTKRSVFSIAQQVLDCFHNNKKERGVDEMLCRLYAPILWRSFSAANATVRANAVSLLVGAFPLQDPSMVRKAKDELVQQQFDVLGGALVDDCPLLRQIGVEGVCRVIASYWEVLPADILSKWFEKLIKDLARDATFPAVRVSVFKGLRFIIANPLAQSTMKRFLPLIGPSLNDPSAAVRGAFLDLLLSIKAIKDVKFWDVTSPDALLERLPLDTPTNAVKITRIISNSFFPVKLSLDEKLWRCLELVRSHRLSARYFYFYLLHCDVSPVDVAQFVALLANYIVHTNAQGDGGDENGEPDVEPLDEDTMVALMEVISVLLKALAKNSKRHGSMLMKLGLAVSPLVAHVQRRFDGNETLQSLALMISSLAPTAVSSDTALERVRTFCAFSPTTPTDYVATYTRMLCDCNQLPAVTFVCEHWLTPLIAAQNDSPPDGMPAYTRQAFLDSNPKLKKQDGGKKPKGKGSAGKTLTLPIASDDLLSFFSPTPAPVGRKGKKSRGNRKKASETSPHDDGNVTVALTAITAALSYYGNNFGAVAGCFAGLRPRLHEALYTFRSNVRSGVAVSVSDYKALVSACLVLETLFAKEAPSTETSNHAPIRTFVEEQCAFIQTACHAHVTTSNGGEASDDDRNGQGKDGDSHPRKRANKRTSKKSRQDTYAPVALSLDVLSPIISETIKSLCAAATFGGIGQHLDVCATMSQTLKTVISSGCASAVFEDILCAASILSTLPTSTASKDELEALAVGVLDAIVERSAHDDTSSSSLQRLGATLAKISKVRRAVIVSLSQRVLARAFESLRAVNMQEKAADFSLPARTQQIIAPLVKKPSVRGALFEAMEACVNAPGDAENDASETLHLTLQVFHHCVQDLPELAASKRDKLLPATLRSLSNLRAKAGENEPLLAAIRGLHAELV